MHWELPARIKQPTSIGVSTLFAAILARRQIGRPDKKSKSYRRPAMMRSGDLEEGSVSGVPPCRLPRGLIRVRPETAPNSSPEILRFWTRRSRPAADTLQTQPPARRAIPYDFMTLSAQKHVPRRPPAGNFLTFDNIGVRQIKA
jgi:hypothetical protein